MLSKPIHHGAGSPGEERKCFLVCVLLWKRKESSKQRQVQRKHPKKQIENPEDKTEGASRCPRVSALGNPPVFFSDFRLCRPPRILSPKGPVSLLLTLGFLSSSSGLFSRGREEACTPWALSPRFQSGPLFGRSLECSRKQLHLAASPLFLCQGPVTGVRGKASPGVQKGPHTTQPLAGSLPGRSLPPQPPMGRARD